MLAAIAAALALAILPALRAGRDPAGDDDRRPEREHRRLRRSGDGRRRQRWASSTSRRVEGVAHVFVSRYVEGHWSAPIRVDTEEPFAASWPRIGAAAGGELIVVWATPFATSPTTGKPVYELLGAELGPGGEHFGQAIIVDRDIEEAHRHQPRPRGQLDRPGRRRLPGGRHQQSGDLAAARGRRAPRACALAHFDGRRWSNLGAINRDAARRRCARRRRPTPPRSRSARRATGWSCGRSPTSKASRGSGRGASSGARSTT